MQPGDEILISVKNQDLMNSLVILLNATPGLKFEVTAKEPGFEIKVAKMRSRSY
jgi:hypothetical protein